MLLSGGQGLSRILGRRSIRGLLAFGLFATSLLFLVVAANGPRAIQDGDQVELSISAYTADGRLVHTNSYLVAHAMNQTQDSSVRPSTDYQPTTVVVGDASSLLGPGFHAAIRGHQEGDKFVTELVPAAETLTGIVGPAILIPRSFGPFPLYEEVNRTLFSRLYPNASHGDRVQLNERFVGEVWSLGPPVVLRLDVDHGSITAVKGLGTATLQTIVDNERGTFSELLTITNQTAFHRKNSHLMNLEPGSYFVSAVGPWNIELGRLRSPLIEFAMEDLRFAVEVIAVD